MYVISQEIVGAFYEKELQKENETAFKVEKEIKTNYMSKEKVMIILLTVWMIKNVII